MSSEGAEIRGERSTGEPSAAESESESTEEGEEVNEEIKKAEPVEGVEASDAVVKSSSVRLVSIVLNSHNLLVEDDHGMRMLILILITLPCRGLTRRKMLKQLKRVEYVPMPFVHDRIGFLHKPF